MNQNKILELLKLLQCPISKGELTYDKDKNMIYSKSADVYFPIKNDIPILLEEESVKL